MWGYLLPLDQKYGKSLVLRKRNACPLPDGIERFCKDGGDRERKNEKDFAKEEDAYEQTKFNGIASGGYLIGRHPECGMLTSHLLRGNWVNSRRSHTGRPHSLKQTLSAFHREQGKRYRGCS